MHVPASSTLRSGTSIEMVRPAVAPFSATLATHNATKVVDRQRNFVDCFCRADIINWYLRQEGKRSNSRSPCLDSRNRERLPERDSTIAWVRMRNGEAVMGFRTTTQGPPSNSFSATLTFEMNSKNFDCLSLAAGVHILLQKLMNVTA